MTSSDQRLILTLDPDLAGRLGTAAQRTGLDPAELTLRCLRNHLDEVTACSRVFDEIAQVKHHLAELAGLVGEVLAEPTPAAIGEFCRYKPAKASKVS